MKVLHISTSFRKPAKRKSASLQFLCVLYLQRFYSVAGVTYKILQTTAVHTSVVRVEIVFDAALLIVMWIDEGLTFTLSTYLFQFHV